MTIQQRLLQDMQLDPTKFSVPQIQQGVENGVIPAYIGIPIIHEIMRQKKMAELAQMAQQPAQQPPVAQQILAAAQQQQGVEALPSNLPTQNYAPGGIVAFDEGGEVQRFQVGGISPEFGGSYTEEEPAKPPRTNAEVARIVEMLKAQGVPIGLSTIKDIQSRRGRFADDIVPTTPSPPGQLFGPPAPPRSLAQLAASQGITMERPSAPRPGVAGLPAARGDVDMVPMFGQLKEKIEQQLNPTPEEVERDKQIQQRGEDLRRRADIAFESIAEMESPEAEAKRQARADEFTRRRQAALEPHTKAVEDTIAERKSRMAAQAEQAKGLALLKAGAAMLSSRSPYFLSSLGEGLSAGASSYEQYLASKEKEQQLIESMRVDSAKMRAAASRDDVVEEEKYANRLRDDSRAALNARITAVKHLIDANNADGDRLVRTALGRARTANEASKIISGIEQAVERGRISQVIAQMRIDAQAARDSSRQTGRQGTSIPPKVLSDINQRFEEFLGNPRAYPGMFAKLPAPLKEKLTKYKPGTRTYETALSELSSYVDEMRRKEIDTLREESARQ